MSGPIGSTSAALARSLRSGAVSALSAVTPPAAKVSASAIAALQGVLRRVDSISWEALAGPIPVKIGRIHEEGSDWNVPVTLTVFGRELRCTGIVRSKEAPYLVLDCSKTGPKILSDGTDLIQAARDLDDQEISR